MLPLLVTVISRPDHDRVVSNAQYIKCMKYHSAVPINQLHHPVVAGYELPNLNFSQVCPFLLHLRAALGMPPTAGMVINPMPALLPISAEVVNPYEVASLMYGITLILSI